ncbi:MAG TPA: GNAT family N-acetyltransferase [Anaerolineaceae bacterium]|nr:GNAT family N-acetyltransferase [Anaerolineaceae bacterium]HPN50154.1 GNAT family N-acetyltransferase [Anaerolineaceae bacterium]
MHELRPYRDDNDLRAMLAVLEQGRKAGGPVHFVHTGDLKWWLFYLDPDFEGRVFLAETEDGVKGWVLFSPRFKAFDVFTLPGEEELRLELFTWAEERLSQQVRAGGGKRICTMWVSERDEILIQHLKGRGFECSEAYMLAMQQTLEGSLPEPSLPEGFCLRHVKGEAEAPLRAAAAHAAFESSKTIEVYTEGYLWLMRSWVYAPERDWVAAAPDGRIAAFCLIWLDEVNQTGHFEPVGTHPDFQRQGLAKALIYEGLYQMRKWGMHTASVVVEADNPSAIKLYEAAGFQARYKILGFIKPV